MGNIRLRILLFGIVFSCICMGAVDEQSFTPTELNYPITKIEISTEMSSNGPSGKVFTLYSCSQQDCNIELTNASALDNLVQPQSSIEAGAYRFIKVTSCADGEDTYTASIKGEVTIDSILYFTDDADGLNELSPNNVTIKFNECTSYYELQEDLEVGDSVASSLRLVFDLTNIAWAKLGAISLLSKYYCFENDALTKAVCMNKPQFIPIISSGTISKESYKVKEDSGYGANIILFMESDTLLGGFARRVFSPSSNALSGAFNTAIKRVVFLSNGVYQFGTVGELSSELSKSNLSFSRFSRDTHSYQYTDSEDTEYDYDATIE
jgi:hypothetical protein